MDSNLFMVVGVPSAVKNVGFPFILMWSQLGKAQVLSVKSHTIHIYPPFIDHWCTISPPCHGLFAVWSRAVSTAASHGAMASEDMVGFARLNRGCGWTTSASIVLKCRGYMSILPTKNDGKSWDLSGYLWNFIVIQWDRKMGYTRPGTHIIF